MLTIDRQRLINPPKKLEGPGLALNSIYDFKQIQSRVAFWRKIEGFSQYLRNLSENVSPISVEAKLVLAGEVQGVAMRGTFQSLFDLVKFDHHSDILEGPENRDDGTVSVKIRARVQEVLLLDRLFGSGKGYHVVMGIQEDFNEGVFVVVEKGKGVSLEARYIFTSNIKEAAWKISINWPGKAVGGGNYLREAADLGDLESLWPQLVRETYLDIKADAELFSLPQIIRGFAI